MYFYSSTAVATKEAFQVSQVSHGEIEVRKIIRVKKWLSEYFIVEMKSLS